MTESVERGRRSGWWTALISLFGASLLVVVGFALGLVAGASWEEPDLLMDHLEGETTEVLLAQLRGEAESAEAGSVSAAPVGAEPAVSAAPVGSEPAVSVAPPVAAAPPVPVPAEGSIPDGFSVQVGAFREREAADTLVGRLSERGFPAYVAVGSPEGAHRWRVRVGPVATRDQADAMADRLKRNERLPTWVVTHDG